MRWMMLVVFVLFGLAFIWGLSNDAKQWQSSKDFYASKEFAKQQKEDDQPVAEAEIKADLTVVYVTMPLYDDFLPQKYRDNIPYVLSFTSDSFMTILYVAVFALGITAVVFERYTRGNRFTAMLPYKRSSIMAVKLILGIGTIIFSYIFSAFMGWSYFTSRIPDRYLDVDVHKFLIDMGGALISFILIFMLAIIIGLLVASPAAGVIVAACAELVPLLFMSGISKINDIIHPNLEGSASKKFVEMSDYFSMFNPFSYESSGWLLLTVSSGIAVFLIVIAVLLFHFQKLERNGQMFAFRWVKWPFIFLTSLSIGILVANMSGGNNLWIYLGWMIGFMAISMAVIILILVKAKGLFQMAKTN